MNNYLSNIPTEINKIENEYHVIYMIEESPFNIVGGCTYKEWNNKSKYQTEPVYLLTEVNMFNIIDYINEKSPLQEGDLIHLQMEIRTDSLSRLKDYLSSGSLSQM